MALGKDGLVGARRDTFLFKGDSRAAASAAALVLHARMLMN